MMTAVPAARQETAPMLRGDGIFRALRAGHIDFVLAVPDLFTSEGFLRPLIKAQSDPAETLRLIRLAREDEGIGIASGLSYCNKRAVLATQYTGFLDSVNALRAVSLDYKLPLVMLIGLLGHEAEVAPKESAKIGVRSVPAILDAMDVPYHAIHDDSHLPLITPAIDRAYDTATPVALLIARKPVAA